MIYFSKLKTVRSWNTCKQLTNSKASEYENVKKYWKRALHRDTAHNYWLKLNDIFSVYNFVQYFTTSDDLKAGHWFLAIMGMFSASAQNVSICALKIAEFLPTQKV